MCICVYIYNIRRYINTNAGSSLPRSTNHLRTPLRPKTIGKKWMLTGPYVLIGRMFDLGGYSLWYAIFQNSRPSIARFWGDRPRNESKLLCTFIFSIFTFFAASTTAPKSDPPSAEPHPRRPLPSPQTPRSLKPCSLPLGPSTPAGLIQPTYKGQNQQVACHYQANDSNSQIYKP